MQKTKPKRYRAEYVAARQHALRDAKAPARQINAIGDTWIKRNPNNVGGFFNAKRAKPALATVTKGVQQ